MATVQLTEYGREVYEYHYTSFYRFVDCENKQQYIDFWIGQVKENGYLTVPVWDLMHVFGTVMTMGSRQVFVDNRIEIVS
jgi:hypothetical protein